MLKYMTAYITASTKKKKKETGAKLEVNLLLENLAEYLCGCGVLSVMLSNTVCG